MLIPASRIGHRVQWIQPESAALSAHCDAADLVGSARRKGGEEGGYCERSRGL